MQPKIDETLETDSNEIVGAINEVNKDVKQIITLIDPMVGTWVFIDTPALPSESFAIKFTDGLGTEYGAIDYSAVEEMFYYSYELGNLDVDAYFGDASAREWAYEEAKRINILEEPSTEAASWIKANAVKQVAEYQPKADESLETTDKTVVGAINEVNKKALVNADGIMLANISEIYNEGNDGIMYNGTFWAYTGEFDNDVLETPISVRLPLVAGNNVTFEEDSEGNVVKINATDGIDKLSAIDLGADSPTYATATNVGVAYNNTFETNLGTLGTVYNFVPIVAGENTVFEDSEVNGNKVVKINASGGVPTCTTDNNGQFLCVVNGEAAWTSVSFAEMEYDSSTQTLSITTS